MTFQDLLDKLKSLTPEQLQAEARYYDGNTGEFFGVRAVHTMAGYSDNEEDDRPVLSVEQ